MQVVRVIRPGKVHHRSQASLWLADATASADTIARTKRRGKPALRHIAGQVAVPTLLVKRRGEGSGAEYALDDFAALPHLETVVNVEPREVLDDFATADVLLLSRSSLGYVAGWLNPHGLVIYPPFMHPPLPGWLVADQHGNLDALEVASRIADHVRRRG